MRPITKCKCGNIIVLSLKSSFKVINKRKLCLRCFNNKDLKRVALGSRNFYPSPLAQALFDTLCALQREQKGKAVAKRERERVKA